MKNVCKEQKETDYTHYLLDVIEWNKTAENGAEPSLEKQIRLVQEEVDELFEAFDKDDVEGFYKELSDCFVVAGYAAYIKWGVREAATIYSNDIEFLLGTLENTLLEDPTVGTFVTILEIMNSVNQKKMVQYLNATLRSNWSKFFAGNPEEEVMWATKNYQGRYEGIRAVKDMYGTYSLKDKNNKIIKPSTYRDYKEYL